MDASLFVALKKHLPVIEKPADRLPYLALAVLVFFAGAFLAALFFAGVAVMVPFPLLHAM